MAHAVYVASALVAKAVVAGLVVVSVEDSVLPAELVVVVVAAAETKQQ